MKCFIMICTNKTKDECIKRGLFGEQEFLFGILESIEQGDIGFLLNVSNDRLMGVFRAEGPTQINIAPEAWEGRFPTQIKVKLIGGLQTVRNASRELERFVRLKRIPNKNYKVPALNVHGPTITEKILSLFDISKELASELQGAEETMPAAIAVAVKPTFEGARKSFENYLSTRTLGYLDDALFEITNSSAVSKEPNLKLLNLKNTISKVIDSHMKEILERSLSGNDRRRYEGLELIKLDFFEKNH